MEDSKTRQAVSGEAPQTEPAALHIGIRTNFFLSGFFTWPFEYSGILRSSDLEQLFPLGDIFSCVLVQAYNSRVRL
jgi:hypothetical protein